MRNRTTNECRKPRAGHGNTDHVVCFQCNQVGHKWNACPMNRPNRSAGPQRVEAMQHFTAPTPTHNYNGPHDTGHRGTLSRVQQEFYWPGVHEYVTRYVASCNLCQRNVSKGTVPKAPMGKLSLISTPFSTICVDIIGPISPPSDGYITYSLP